MTLEHLRAGAPHERKGLFRFAVFMTGAVTFLLLAGAAVKSTESGLAVPDWPLSFGQVMPPMEGGVFYEHGHRMVATAVGFLTIVLAVWLWMRDPRPAMRRLGWIALLMVIVQGVLGGITVLMKLPVAVSAAHACLAQAFFLVIVYTALSLSEGWNLNTTLDGVRGSKLPLWATLATVAIFIQLILGAVTRHLEAALVLPTIPAGFIFPPPPAFTPEVAAHYAHRVGAVVVTLLVLVAALHALALARGRRDFSVPAILMLVLVAAQFTLGVLVVITQRHVHPTTTHVVVGALLLAVSFLLTARSWRFIGSPFATRKAAGRAFDSTHQLGKATA